MPDDSRDRMDDLRDSVDVDAQVAEQLKNTGPTQGFDDTRAVRVDLDGEGQLTGVKVDAGWQRLLRDNQLAPAVLSAYQHAVTGRLEAWGQAAEQAGAGGLRPRPRPGMHETVIGRVQERLAARGVTIDDTHTLNRLLDMLDELDVAMQQAEADADAMAATKVSARSGSGHVTATVSGAGNLVGLEFDQRWVGRAHGFNISRETLDALGEARRRLAQRTAESAPFARLNALSALSRDPVALIEYLGLDDSPPAPEPPLPGSFR